MSRTGFVSYTSEDAPEIAAAYLASGRFAEAWSSMVTALETWGWSVADYEPDYHTARFYCGPYPAAFEHSMDLGISRERFDKGASAWCALELVNHVLLGLPWMQWWSEHKVGQNPFGSNSHPSPFRDALAHAIHDEVRPKIRAHPAFQRGMDELFELVTSEEVLAASRERITKAATSRLSQAVRGLREVGWSDEQVRAALDEALTA